MYKKLAAVLTVVGVLASAGPVFALPTNEQKGDNNPQVVAFYPTGDHGIVGESDTHTGADLVMKNGNSGNFQQWFYGTSTENGGNTEGDHSIWQSVGETTTCNGNATLVENASATMGSYLQPGNYCVRTNDFRVSP